MMNCGLIMRAGIIMNDKLLPSGTVFKINIADDVTH